MRTCNIMKELLEGLNELKSTLFFMIEKTSAMVNSTMPALLNRDLSAWTMIADLENDVNRLQLQIDDQCSRMLALQQPVAHDLRFIIAAMKISSDLERIADQCISLLNHTKALKEFPDVGHLA